MTNTDIVCLPMRSMMALVTILLFQSLPGSNAFLVPKSNVCSTTPRTPTSLYSIPNGLDTLTSGLASICRLPKGVTALESSNVKLPRFTRLWDIENCRACRQVREALTELDVVVERVIPAATNSRSRLDATYDYALPSPSTAIPRLVVVEGAKGQERVLSGVDEILAYLDTFKPNTDNTMSSSSNDNTPEQLAEAKEMALMAWDKVGNFLAAALRMGRGTTVTNAATMEAVIAPPRPSQPLILFSYEGNQFCRLVREVLTELDLVHELQSAGKESPRRTELAELTGGSSQCPYLIDPNTNVQMAESKDIIAYLYKTYANWTPPNELLQWTSAYVMQPLLQPLFQILAPLQAKQQQRGEEGGYTPNAYERDLEKAKAEIENEIEKNPVVVYTYEWSPFCTEATDMLKRLDVTFREVSLGKEWIPGLIDTSGPIKRAALLEMTGQSSLPHVFIGGKSMGGLFSGTPGLVPLLESGKEINVLVETASRILEKRKKDDIQPVAATTKPTTTTTTTTTITTPAAAEKEKETEDVGGSFE